ncbi:MAG: hypothetical protein LBK61_10830 [Spirochaetaceae bacterium]|nr:hypothetical protein [Spirochaetaceae bacterium]
MNENALCEFINPHCGFMSGLMNVCDGKSFRKRGLEPAHSIKKEQQQLKWDSLNEREIYQILSLRRSVLLLLGALIGLATFITKTEAAIPTHSLPNNSIKYADLRKERVESPFVLFLNSAKRSIV